MGVEHQNFFEGRATTYMKAGLRGRPNLITFANMPGIKNDSDSTENKDDTL